MILPGKPMLLSVIKAGMRTWSEIIDIILLGATYLVQHDQSLHMQLRSARPC